MRGRRGAVPRDAQSAVEIVEERSRATADSIRDMARAADEHVRADDEERERDDAEHAERNPRRRQPDAREADEEHGP